MNFGFNDARGDDVIEWDFSFALVTYWTLGEALCFASLDFSMPLTEAIKLLMLLILNFLRPKVAIETVVKLFDYHFSSTEAGTLGILLFKILNTPYDDNSFVK